MRKIFTIFGDERELKLIKELESVQEQIKEERRKQREELNSIERRLALALNARNEQEYAISTQLVQIFTLYQGNKLKEAITSLINLHKSLLETYKNHQSSEG